MAANINNWNVNPNQKWYVKVGPSAGKGLIQLFNTKTDAQAETKRVAYGSFEFGTAVEVTLTNDSTEPDIAIFNDHLKWHLKATLESGDPAKIFELGPFTDLPEVSDPLLVDSQGILDRATREIDEHTHSAIHRDIPLAVHFQDLDIGDIARIRENMRGLDVTARVEEVVTRGDKDSLVDTIKLVEFKDVTR